MSDPFEILGLPRDADEAAIRRRYLELVREFPPERAPERFAAIRVAYDEAREPVARIEARLFGADHDSFESLAADLRARLRRGRLPTDVLLSLGESP